MDLLIVPQRWSNLSRIEWLKYPYIPKIRYFPAAAPIRKVIKLKWFHSSHPWELSTAIINNQPGIACGFSSANAKPLKKSGDFFLDPFAILNWSFFKRKYVPTPRKNITTNDWNVTLVLMLSRKSFPKRSRFSFLATCRPVADQWPASWFLRFLKS